jgi:hypothetical protein
MREALCVGAVRNSGKKVLRDLRFFVMRHLHARRGTQRSGTAPLRYAAAM